MTAYALRLANGADTAARSRFADLLGLMPGASALTARSGLRPDGGGVVTVQAGTMNVKAASFAAWVQGGVSVTQGGYVFVSDAEVTLALSVGHASLTRVDTIVARVRDNPFDGSGSVDAQVVVVEGTPGAGAPALPTNCVPLRDISVPAGLAVGTGGLQPAHLSTDRRQYLAAAGGIVRVASQAERDGLGAREGVVVYRADTDRLEAYDGAAWKTYAPETDTGWLVLTHAGTSGDLWYRVRNGVVYVEGAVNFAALANGATVTLLATGANAIPAAYRPGHALNMAIARLNGGTQQGILTALADGSITVQNQSGVSVGSAQFRYSYPME